MSKLEKCLFYLLLFSIPFQTRKILWHSPSAGGWYFNEWQAISLYATDILLLTLFAFWAINYFLSKNYRLRITYHAKGFKPLLKKPGFYLALFIVISAVSVLNAQDKLLGLFSLLKIIEFTVFYFYIKNYAIRRFGFVNGLIAVVAGGTFQAVVALIQFFKQSDLGLRLMGESILGLGMTGIASFYNSAGELVIRAYGTTPHPNVLASYLFLSLFSFYFAYLYFHIYHKEKEFHPKLNLFLLVSHPLILLAFFFTFARVAIFLWFLGFGIRTVLVLGIERFRRAFGDHINRTKLTGILISATAVVVLFGIFYWPEAISRVKISGNEEAVQQRIFYNKESVSSGISWIGVGPGNFVNWLMEKEPNLPRNLYQPVHNIYLLLYKETGLLGTASLAVFLILLIRGFIERTRLQKFYHYSFLLVALSILFMGLFDHFLLTIQQGRFMFWLVLAQLASWDENML